VRTLYCRDHLVLARWSAFGRICLLLDTGNDHARAVYEPAGDGPFEELPAGALIAGMHAFRAAFARARRVIETGKNEREAWRKSAELHRMELDALDDQAGLYVSSLAEFERAHGRGYPITEDLLLGGERCGSRRR
jgi:hypothetical protein